MSASGFWKALAGLTGSKGAVEKAAAYRPALLPLLAELDHGLDGIVGPGDLVTKLGDLRARAEVLGGGTVRVERAKTEVNRSRDHFVRTRDRFQRLRTVPVFSILPLADLHGRLVRAVDAYLTALHDCNWSSQLAV